MDRLIAILTRRQTAVAVQRGGSYGEHFAGARRTRTWDDMIRMTAGLTPANKAAARASYDYARRARLAELDAQRTAGIATFAW